MLRHNVLWQGVTRPVTNAGAWTIPGSFTIKARVPIQVDQRLTQFVREPSPPGSIVAVIDNTTKLGTFAHHQDLSTLQLLIINHR